MTEREPLIALLRELDDDLARQGMPLGAQHRIAAELRERTEEGIRNRGWLPMITFACGAALVLLVFAFGAWPAPVAPEPSEVAARPSVGSFVVEGQRCRSESIDGAARHRLLGYCSLVGDHMTISSWNQAVVVDRGRSIDVETGRVLFDVQPVRPGEDSIMIGVSGGTIEVVGTRFEVDQGPDGGRVDLFEGKIRFHDPDGTVTDVAPGTRHAWGDRREAVMILEPTDDADVQVEILDVEPARVRARPPSEPRRTAREAAEIIERVDRLRRSGRTSEGAALLRRAVDDRWDPRTAQVLSYELGEFLHRYVGDRDGACRHFAAHQRRFPRGRYRTAVERIRERLACE
jgi:hypothetical protein